MRTRLVRSLVTTLALCSSVAPALATTSAPPPSTAAEPWREVAAPTLRHDGRAFIVLAAGADQLTTLRLRNPGAEATQVRQLVVEFRDGTTLIRRGLAEMLAGGKPLKLDLGATPRAVKRVVVYGDAGAQLAISAR
jgi:hypothetical protein